MSDFAQRAIEANQRERAEVLRAYGKQGIDVVVGGMVADLGYTRSAISLATPEEWDATAGFLEALLDRAPLASQSRYSAMRMLIGGFATELGAYARAAGIRPPDA